MIEESSARHIRDLAADYVLGILPTGDRRYVSRHISQCTDCRKSVDVERKLVSLVKSTVEASGQGRSQLEALMPSTPREGFGSLAGLFTGRRVAIAGLVVLLFLGGINLQLNQKFGGLTVPESTAYVATASYTHTPTVAISSPTPSLSTANGRKSSSQNQGLPQPLVTPAPSAINAK